MPALLTRMSTAAERILGFRDHAGDGSVVGHVGAAVEHLDVVAVGELAADRLDLLRHRRSRSA